MAVSGTLVKRIMVKITADDMDAEAKLDAITAKADELAEKNPDLKVKIDSAAAMAKMKVLRDEIRAATAVPVDFDPAVQDAMDRTSALRDELDKLAEKAATGIKIKPDDRDANLKLLQLKAKLADLSEKTADPKIKVSGVARAEADIEAVKLDMDRLEKSQATPGLLQRLFSSLRGGAGGLVGGIPGLGGVGGSIAGDAEDAGGSSPGGMGVMGGVIAALVAASPAIVTELTGVVSGFAAAGAGAVAFGALAYPTIKQITGAVGDTKAQLDKLPKPIQTAVGEIKSLEGQFDSLAKKYAPQVTGLFSQVAGIASAHAPKILDALAKPVSPALSGLLTQLDKGLNSKGFSNWLKLFSSLEGPSITSIGTGIGHLATNLGKLLTMMSKPDVQNAINIAFSVIDGALIGFIGFVHYSMVTWDALTAAWDKGTAAVRRAGHDIAAGFDVARHAAATGGHVTASAFDVIRHGAATAGHDTASSFDTMRHRIATALDGNLNFVKSHWKSVASFLVNPVATAVFEVRTHLHQIAREFDSLRHDASSILAGMRHDIASAFDGARHDASAAMDRLRHDVASAWDGLRHDAAKWGDDMVHAVKGAWDSIFGSTKTGSGKVTGEVGKLPGQIKSLLAGLPGDMLRIGKNTINGLINGIKSAATAIPGLMKSLAGQVESYFTDPLKIFSPSRVMFEHGLMVPEGVALGIEAGSPRIRQAAAGMARAVSGTALGAHGAAAGTAAAGSHVTIQISGDAALRQWLKKSIRVTGGNVQVVGA